MNELKINRLSDKRNFVAIFVSISVVGLLLIGVAVYNASRELEIVHQIDNLYQLMADRLRHRAGDIPKDLGQWAREHSTDEYQVFVMNEGARLDARADDQSLEPYLNARALQQSKINDRGGYIEEHGKIIAWARVPVGGLAVVIAHEFRHQGVAELVHVFARRLFLPAAFYIWVVVWGSLILGHLLDRLRTQKQAMEHLALHDPLTGLPNRHLLSDRLTKLMQAADRDGGTFALAVIDLDRFKDVNDTYGHDAGDRLLVQIAARLSGALRASDTAARLGGDEFTILMPDLDGDACTALCSRIAETLSKGYELDGRAIAVGCSIGAALYPVHGRTSDELMRAADNAMYRVKLEGGGVYVNDATLGGRQLTGTGAC